ncbi:MAG: biotin synthase BioB [Clostridia bacterium]|jgi:biotin synthase|nr:biotin synthase BioB [Clostridia bacterium]
MSVINECILKIQNGKNILKSDALCLYKEDLDELLSAANQIKNEYCNKFDMCSLINAKSGNCSENCKFCAQSAFYKSKYAKEGYSLLSKEKIFDGAKYNFEKGVKRFAIVTSGRALNDEEVDCVCEAVRFIKSKINMKICVSGGLMNYNQFCRLKDSGVTGIHNNLESSESFFKTMCSTHTRNDKIEAIKAAQKAGLKICCGGIIGLGESIEDRIDMVINIRELGIKSIPVNILEPISGTPCENNKPLTEEEILRTVAVFRFLVPDSFIRMAGGRSKLSDYGEKCFKSGANAAITGDMLTTCGISIEKDFEIVKNCGYQMN